ncbi:hypothetical protein J3459_011333 [Metarhizium acridum]|nr:hypothetical protein J3459_011333 [Metarhizium acridum]
MSKGQGMSAECRQPTDWNSPDNRHGVGCTRPHATPARDEVNAASHQVTLAGWHVFDTENMSTIILGAQRSSEAKTRTFARWRMQSDKSSATEQVRADMHDANLRLAFPHEMK